MTTNQIYNIFHYCGIMLLDNKLIITSPDYLKEKTLSFMGKLGKNEFIEFPKIKYSYQKFERIKRKWNRNDIIFDNLEDNFWSEYCKIWNVNENDYQFMNIINYLMNINFLKQNSFFDNFEKYFGYTNTISNKNLDYKVHPLLLEDLENYIDFESRYLKLKSLG